MANREIATKASEAANVRESARRASARELIARVRNANGASSPLANFFARPELVALAASLLLAFAVILSYFFWLVPARNRLANLQDERDTLQRKLRNATQGIQEGQTTQESVAAIAKSLRDFESDRLTSRATSRTAVIEELNALIRRNNLHITTGVTFAALNDTTQNQLPGSQTQTTTTSRGGSFIKQTVYPGTGITLSVEGAYPSLRRFLRDIEASRQFIVINAVQLESVQSNKISRAATENFNQAVPPAAAGGATPGANPQTPNPQAQQTPVEQNPTASSPSGAIVSLRLEMAAYFRPERSLDAGDASDAKANSPQTDSSSATTEGNGASR